MVDGEMTNFEIRGRRAFRLQGLKLDDVSMMDRLSVDGRPHVQDWHLYRSINAEVKRCLRRSCRRGMFCLFMLEFQPSRCQRSGEVF